MSENYFVTLNNINVNGKTEKKNNLTYLSWAWAWAEVKKLFPEATYTIYEDANGLFYHTDGKTCWVKTGVTVNGIEHIEYLPVMDYKNQSIPLEKVTSFDVNKAIQRSLTKAVARHGLGLYIYAGEDLPEAENPSDKVDDSARQEFEKVRPLLHCEDCGKKIVGAKRKDGTVLTASSIADGTKQKFGRVLCLDCARSIEAVKP
nr:MAG: Protein of unknown function (DUF1071) [Bacteriophage sp.]